MNKIIWIILIILVIGAVSYFVFSKKNINTSTQTQSSPTSIAENTVIIKNFAFEPPALTVAKGTTVTWENKDGTAHSIKSADFNSPNLSDGQTFQFQFNASGTYNYSCAIHPTIAGTIIVK